MPALRGPGASTGDRRAAGARFADDPGTPGGGNLQSQQTEAGTEDLTNCQRSLLAPPLGAAILNLEDVALPSLKLASRSPL
jgi:hypothetical protein